MDLPSTRVVPAVVRVGDKEVELRIIEEYAPGTDCGIPVHVRIAGPNGLKTQGKLPDAWQEMLELLGVRKPAVSIQHSAFGQDELAHSAPQSASIQSERPAVAGVEERPAAFTPPIATQNQTQTQNPAGAAAAPVVQAAAPVVWAAPVVSAADEFEDDMKLNEEEEREEEVDVEETSGLNENVLRDSMLRLLNRRIYSDDPPLKIDEKMVAFIPYLESTQEAANLIRHIDENIQLTEMKADASRRASNLNYLKKANRAKRCGHVKVSGQTCGSPALRGQLYCHFHAQAHGAGLDLPLIEDQSSLQLAYMKVAQQVAANKIDPAQARVLLQVLAKAGRGLPKSESMVERRFPGI